MVQKLKNKLSAMLEKRMKKGDKNKGFTLVELIVVIVILAILVGVTIGGVYAYVGKSRINTDINNASSITSTLSVVTTIADAKPSGAENEFTVDIAGVKRDDLPGKLKLESCPNATAKIKELFPDGIPACKTAEAHLNATITRDATSGLITSIKVVAVDKDGKALVGEN